jgi:hypothetical protein
MGDGGFIDLSGFFFSGRVILRFDSDSKAGVSDPLVVVADSDDAESRFWGPELICVANTESLGRITAALVAFGLFTDPGAVMLIGGEKSSSKVAPN